MDASRRGRGRGPAPGADVPEGFPVDLTRAILVGVDGLDGEDAGDEAEGGAATRAGGTAPLRAGSGGARDGPPPPLRLAPEAAELVRREIARAGGREVCFLARVDPDGRIVREPRAVARGNFQAVLAAARDAQPGSVMIHNHPSGEMAPSSADLDVAAELYERGIGTAITDNAASALYVVVEPPEPRERIPLDVAALDALLAPGGALSRRHAAYEDRPGQREMLRLVAERFNAGGVALVEAGTGTGKSLAYLLPAVRWAVQNDERCVVSTATINLQEQLAGKDLPLVRDLLGGEVSWALAKGRGNYVSIRRALLAVQEQGSLFEDDRSAELSSIVRWMEETRDGSLSDLGFTPADDTWDEVRSDPDACLGKRCPHFEACHYQNARRRAAAARVLVVNHHLLFSDLAVRRATDNWTRPAVLPPYGRLVLDEAHNVEDAVTQHLGVEVTRRALFRVLGRLDRGGRRGILAAVHEAAGGSAAGRDVRERLENEVRPALERARGELDGFLEALDGVAARVSRPARLGTEGVGEPVERPEVRERLDGLVATWGVLGRALRAARAAIELDGELEGKLEGRLLDLRSVERRLAAHGAGVRLVLDPGDAAGRWVRWLDVRGAGRRANLVLAAAPIEVGPLLRDSLLAHADTTVLTSATLSTRGGFAFQRQRMGLVPEESEGASGRLEDSSNESLDVKERIIQSPFDYNRSTVLAVPTDLPPAEGGGSPAFHAATARVAAELAALSDGGIFVLFTSHGALRRVAEDLRARGVEGRWPLFVHGEADRHRLLDAFTASGRGILLGTASFWEGVDVPGEPLRGLLIQKLPFRVPTEPVTAARMEALERAGRSPFHDFMLPHAALRLKQGFGRLVRSHADRGAVLVLDDRLVTRRYGRYLRASLPDVPLVRGPWEEVRLRVAAFYGVVRDARGVARTGLGTGSAPS